MKAKNEDRAEYRVTTQLDTSTEDAIIAQAQAILTARLHRDCVYLDTPQTVRDWLILHYAALEHEEFGCIFLDTGHRIIAAESMFRGTLSQTSVYPREIIKTALKHNAAAVILYHNHPSGISKPSRADEMLTKMLQSALTVIDVLVLDHFIVAGTAKPYSFAEHDLL